MSLLAVIVSLNCVPACICVCHFPIHCGLLWHPLLQSPAQMSSHLPPLYDSDDGADWSGRVIYIDSDSDSEATEPEQHVNLHQSQQQHSQLQQHSHLSSTVNPVPAMSFTPRASISVTHARLLSVITQRACCGDTYHNAVCIGMSCFFMYH